MLSRSEVDEWLSRDTPRERLHALLTPELPVPLAAVPVSTYVNTSKNQGSRCVDPVAAPVEIAAG